MTAIDPSASDAAQARAREDRRAKRFARISKLDGWFKVLGLPWLTPILRLAAGDTPKTQLKSIWQLLGVPLVAILAFLALWGALAPKVQTSLGAIPGPAAVWEQVGVLHADAQAEKVKEAEFYARQDERNAQLVAEGKADKVKIRAYTGKPTYYQQIWTSIQTVFFGFLIGTAVAVPLGIVAGLSPTANAAINPLVQIFKPVSPLAWLPIVTMIVSALYVTGEGTFSKSFVISAVTVTLCSLWPDARPGRFEHGYHRDRHRVRYQLPAAGLLHDYDGPAARLVRRDPPAPSLAPLLLSHRRRALGVPQRLEHRRQYRIGPEHALEVTRHIGEPQAHQPHLLESR